MCLQVHLTVPLTILQNGFRTLLLIFDEVYGSKTLSLLLCTLGSRSFLIHQHSYREPV